MTSDYDSAWYGTYKVALDEPEPTENSSYWPPEIYVSPYYLQVTRAIQNTATHNYPTTEIYS